jgi:hypothetical protein
VGTWAPVIRITVAYQRDLGMQQFTESRDPGARPMLGDAASRMCRSQERAVRGTCC